MAPDPQTLIFWTIACVAAWVQSLTGFALGLILMGSVGLFGLIPLPQAAVITSILVVANSALFLSTGWREVSRPLLTRILLGAVPTLILGYALLGWLAASGLGLLQLLLGLVIALAALQLAMRPRPLAEQSPGWSFLLAGATGGVLGGLFATTGPPVIYHIYRQPLPLAVVRATLIAVFFVTQSERLLLATLVTGLDGATLARAAGAIPAVALGTWIGRRLPPPFPVATIRRIALALLFLSGVSMVATALSRIAG